MTLGGKALSSLSNYTQALVNMLRQKPHHRLSERFDCICSFYDRKANAIPYKTFKVLILILFLPPKDDEGKEVHLSFQRR